MKKEYEPKKIEPIVQTYWEKNKTFRVFELEKKEKFYCLSMLPYPSGNLHMGHVRNYTISDVISRYQRMLGKNVLHPIGWDAFGLPAEEAAIKKNTSPSLWIKKNIKRMKNQLRKIGFSYDWEREINTSSSDFYRWEQWFFIKLYEKNLVYEKKTLVHWCNFHKTVLANEQVIKGLCWRCSNPVVERKVRQWFLKISNYSQKLLNGLKKLKSWPKKVVSMQENWIGKTEGIEIKLCLKNRSETFSIFTNKIEHIMEMTYCVISPCHKFVKKCINLNNQEKKLIENFKIFNISKKFKLNFGINTGCYIIHPITKLYIPLWIGSYVSLEYGKKARMGVPIKNEQDFNFAKKHFINIKNTNLIYINKSIKNNILERKIINFYLSKKSSNKKTKNKKLKLLFFKIFKEKRIAKKKTFFNLKDWSISRQRYWGTPIPIARTKKGEILLIDENKLPVTLPKCTNLKEINNTIKENKEWRRVIIDKKTAYRESDTFDTFIESSWYHVRYTSPNFSNGIVDIDCSNYWLPIDQYIGGIEHATMHLIYFRFYHKLLYEFGLVPTDEPVKKLLCQGMVLSNAFYQLDKKNNRNWIHPSLVDCKKNEKGKIIKSYLKTTKEEVVYAGMIKMSKSKNNGIDPELIVKKYGADTLRLFIMFAAPVTMELEWNEKNLVGSYRFIKKVWALFYKYVQKKRKKIEKIKPILFNEKQKNLYSKIHETIKKVSNYIEVKQTFNTAISSIMELVNAISNFSFLTNQDHSIERESLFIISKLLYPFTPHLSFYLWEKIAENTHLDEESWPIFQEKFILKKNLLVIQINGKKIQVLNIEKYLQKSDLIDLAKKDQKIRTALDNLTVKKIIYVPKKILNFVVTK